MKNIEIRTERLVLKPIGPAFTESTFVYASDAENTWLMMFMPYSDLEETKSHLEHFEAEWQKDRPVECEFAILLDGVHIGEVGVDFLQGPDLAELGWVLHPDYHGHGYATEAARAVMDFGIHTLHARHFIAHCDSENVASQAVMRKLGMRLTDDTGTRRNRANDEIRRELLYELYI